MSRAGTIIDEILNQGYFLIISIYLFYIILKDFLLEPFACSALIAKRLKSFTKCTGTWSMNTLQWLMSCLAAPLWSSRSKQMMPLITSKNLSENSADQRIPRLLRNFVQSKNKSLKNLDCLIYFSKLNDFQAIRPDTLRAKFGLNKVQNAIHCTDLDTDGAFECNFMFNVLWLSQKSLPLFYHLFILLIKLLYQVLI